MFLWLIKSSQKYIINWALFNPPTSRQHQLISVTSDFMRLSMKTKNVCRGLISLYVFFHKNRTMWSTNLHVNVCRCGRGKEKEPLFDYYFFIKIMIIKLWPKFHKMVFTMLKLLWQVLPSLIV